MSQPFLGEIRMFAGNFAPAGYAFCNGQLQSVAQNNALFAILGTTYGGDGQTTFNLPDLRGRLPVHQGTRDGVAFIMGESAGTETVTPTVQQIAQHLHSANVSSAGDVDTPVGNYPAADPAGNDVQWKASTAASANMGATAIGNAGGNQPHANIQPLLAVNYIIALQGIFPSRN